MGNDYQLKKIYEQMLKGKSEELSTPQKPRTLNEAYKHILTERTAFYSKNVEGGEDVPDVPGLKKVGAVENPEKIEHIIASQSVLPALETAMSADVTGWGAIKGVDIDKVAKDFIVSKVSGPDLETIINNRNKLNALEEKAKEDSPKTFNLAELIVKGIKSNLKIDATSQSLELIFKRLFDEEGSISGTAVGKGELAISLFTNCRKGKTGDLVLPSTKNEKGEEVPGKTIEVKGLGGRLGPAEYSQNRTAKDLVEFLKKLAKKDDYVLNRDLTKVKTKIKKYPIALETDNKDLYDKIFTDKFKLAFNNIADNLDKPEILDIIDKLGFKQSHRTNSTISEETVWNTFSELGYIKPRDPEIPVAPMEKTYAKDIQNNARNFLLDSSKGLLKKGRIEKVLAKNTNLESLGSQTFTVAVQNFFLNDLELTPEEAAQAFLYTKSYDKNVNEYYPEIETYFQKHYTKMTEGELVYLQAAIFGFQLALYAQAGEEGKHFDYFMMINNNNMNALIVDVTKQNLFTYLSDLYIENASKIDLSIRADGRQGGSAVTLK